MVQQAFGHRAVFGFGPETTWGTLVGPTKFLELEPGGFGIQLQQKTIVKPTQNTVRQRYYGPGKRSWNGPVAGYLPYQGAEYLFYYAMGGTVTSALVASGVYTNTFTLGDTLPAGLSIYWSPDYTALATAYGYSGGFIKSLTLTQEHENFIKFAVDLEGSDETSVSQSTPTYPTFNGVHWGQVTTLTIGAVSYNCYMAEFKLENALADGRYKLGQRTRVGMGRSGVRKVSGKIQIELDQTTAYALFQNFTETSINAVWTGLIAGGSTPFQFSITLPRVVFQGSSPKVSGLGPITLELPFESLYTGAADEIQVVMQNLTTAVP